METLKSPITTINGNVYNSEDMMSIPTSLITGKTAVKEDIIEFALEVA
jgi:hypothetical protein